MKFSEETIARFWAKVKKTGGCWEWNASKSKRGYGRFSVNGQNIYAHRFSFIVAKGSIEHELLICHHCDNPSCVRPCHLFAGTHQDNANDAASKGRIIPGLKLHPQKAARGLRHGKFTHPEKRLIGAKNGRAKLNFEIAQEIRSQYMPGVRGRGKHVLAKRFGVSRATIRDIVTGRRWTA